MYNSPLPPGDGLGDPAGSGFIRGYEYAAKEIKLAVVGKGGADKVQVQHMVGVMLNLQGKLQADAADALGVALTHAHLRAALKRVGVTAQQLWRRK